MKPRSRERGMTIPMMALFIVTLFAMAALAVDLGVLYTARTSAQHAADAAALAGAFTFMTPGAPQPDTARAAAIAAGNKNSILGTKVAITADNINVEIDMRRVTVTVPRTGANGVETFFAKAIGWTKADVQVQAMAEAASKGSATACLKPFYVPNTIISSLDPDKACAANQYIFNPDLTLSTYAKANLDPTKVYDLTPGSPKTALVSSQYYLLDFGSGGKDVNCTIANCLNECGVDTQLIKCGQDLPVEPGGKIGPIDHGVEDLTGWPTPDTWGGLHNGVWSYHPDGNGSVWSMTSRSLVIAPVWNNCTQPITPGSHGQTAKVVGYVELFVDGMSGKAMEGHLVQPIQCSTTGGSSGGTGENTGPYGVPVRLVNEAKN